jgi:hypothetical protein
MAGYKPGLSLLAKTETRLGSGVTQDAPHLLLYIAVGKSHAGQYGNAAVRWEKPELRNAARGTLG